MIVNFWLYFQILEEETLSQNQNLCNTCVSELIRSFLFRKKIINSIEKLREEEYANKTELETNAEEFLDEHYLQEYLSEGEDHSQPKQYNTSSENESDPLKVETFENCLSFDSSSEMQIKPSNKSIGNQHDNNRILKTEIETVIVSQDSIENMNENEVYDKNTMGFSVLNEKPQPLSKDGFHYCPLCDVKYKHRQSVIRHINKKHCTQKIKQDETLKTSNEKDCSENVKTFQKRKRLVYECPYCDVTHVSKWRSQNHINIKHLNKPPDVVKNYLCPICGQLFTSPSSYSDHYKKHFPESLFRCQYCNKPYATKYHCKQHEKMHTDDRQFFCEQCDYSCIRRIQMKVS